MLREIFQDIRFRRALSLAINRDEINESVFFGVAVPRQATLHSGATFYKPEWGEEHPYARYDPAAAQELLDEMGLTERDADGFRLRPDGKTALLIIEYPTSMSSTSVTVHETGEGVLGGYRAEGAVEARGIRADVRTHGGR